MLSVSNRRSFAVILIILIHFFNKANIFEMSTKFVKDKNNHNNFKKSCLYSILPLSS